MNWRRIHAWHKFSQWVNPLYVDMQIKKGLRRYFPREGLTNINLSLASLCSSDCIFCPSERGSNICQKFMTLALVEKIVRELRSGAFRKDHNVQIVSMGENGDAFLNKEILPILRLIRRELPHVNMICYTNFRTFAPDIIDVVMKENLLNFVGCNIDSADEATYFAVKRTDLKKVLEHLNYFLVMRRKWRRDIPLGVGMLTLYTYVHSIYNNYGDLPLKLKDRNMDINKIKDDSEEIRRLILPLLDHPKDKLWVTQPVLGWAERPLGMRQKIDYANLSCPLLERIKEEAFIAPDGLWYACCSDGNNELALGHVDKQSLNDIFRGGKRRSLLKALEERQYQKIGGPCLTVNCCQGLDINPSKQ
jgi:MoaA/NifB/PqqE/SkfB family radical SAM enzyme